MQGPAVMKRAGLHSRAGRRLAFVGGVLVRWGVPGCCGVWEVGGGAPLRFVREHRGRMKRDHLVVLDGEVVAGPLQVGHLVEGTGEGVRLGVGEGGDAGRGVGGVGVPWE